MITAASAPSPPMNHRCRRASRRPSASSARNPRRWWIAPAGSAGLPGHPRPASRTGTSAATAHSAPVTSTSGATPTTVLASPAAAGPASTQARTATEIAAFASCRLDAGTVSGTSAWKAGRQAPWPTPTTNALATSTAVACSGGAQADPPIDPPTDQASGVVPRAAIRPEARTTASGEWRSAITPAAGSTTRNPTVRAASATPRPVAGRLPATIARPSTNGSAQVASPEAVVPIHSRMKPGSRSTARSPEVTHP